MTRYKPRPRHYQSRDAVPRPMSGVRWWRAPDYERAGDVIAPVGSPEPVHLDPHGIRWDDLIRWGQTYQIHPADRERTPIDDTLADDICEWCRAFGLPGYLLASTQAIYLPDSVEVEPHPTDPADVHLWSSVTTYQRAGARWITDVLCSSLDDDTGTAARVERHAIPTGDMTHFCLEQDMTSDYVLSTSIDRLAEHLCVPVSECPSPETSAFWAVYHEPIADILRAGRLLGAVKSELADPRRTRPVAGLYDLMQGTAWAPDARSVPEMRVVSLLNAFAVANVLTEWTPRMCERDDCRSPFMPKTPSQRFCSPRCQSTADKRKQRQSVRESKAGGSNRRSGYPRKA